MDSRRPAIRRIVLYAAAVGLVFGFAVATGNIPSSDEARDFGDSLGPAAPFLYVPLFVLANFLIAWIILAGAAGLLFGTAAGTPLALAGLTLASLAQMAVSRRLAGEHRGRLLPQRTKRVENFLTENGAVAVMESRIIPLLPYGVVNYSAGLTHLPYKAMALGTVIGAAPKVFAYTALGGSLDDLDSPEALTAIALLVILGIAGALFVKLRLAASPPPRESQGTPPAA
ncbi:MAG TPA: VTT domain-containing protein [Thermoleophilaceae bacterium]